MINNATVIKKRWSDFEIATLRSAYESGLRTKQIARRLNRSWDSVNKALDRFEVRTHQRKPLQFPKTGSLPHLVYKQQLPLNHKQLENIVQKAFIRSKHVKRTPCHHVLIHVLGLGKSMLLGTMPSIPSSGLRLEDLSPPLPLELQSTQSFMPKNFEEVIQWIQIDSGIEIIKTIYPGHQPFYSIKDLSGYFSKFQHSLLSQSQILMLINKYRKNIGLKVFDIHDIIYK